MPNIKERLQSHQARIREIITTARTIEEKFGQDYAINRRSKPIPKQPAEEKEKVLLERMGNLEGELNKVRARLIGKPKKEIEKFFGELGQMHLDEVYKNLGISKIAVNEVDEFGFLTIIVNPSIKHFIQIHNGEVTKGRIENIEDEEHRAIVKKFVAGHHLEQRRITAPEVVDSQSTNNKINEGTTAKIHVYRGNGLPEKAVKILLTDEASANIYLSTYERLNPNSRSVFHQRLEHELSRVPEKERLGKIMELTGQIASRLAA